MHESSLKFFSITCGHTKEALKCAEWGVASDDPSISRDGKVSRALITERDPQLGEAISRGLTWRVIKWEAKARWSRLVDLIVEADNLPFATAKMDGGRAKTFVRWCVSL